MRGYIIRSIIIVSLLVLIWPGRALAEEGEGIKIDNEGMVTLVSGYAAQEGISSISFSLSVHSANADRVEFYFNESAAKIQEFRYDKENQKLNVYIAGTEPLLDKDSMVFAIGRIEILDENGSSTSATVSVAAGSLMYVYGTELKWMADLELPDEVQVNASGGGTETPSPEPSQESQPTQEPSETPTSSSEPSQTQESMSEPEPSGMQQSTSEPEPSGTQQPTSGPKPSGMQQPTSGSEPSGLAAGSSEPAQNPEPSQESAAAPETSASGETGEGSKEPGNGSIAVSGTQEPEDSSTEEAGGKTQGIDWVFVMAIAAIALFVAVAAMAIVMLKRKPRQDRYEDDF